MPQCPHCNEEILFDSTYDEYFEDDKYNVICDGSCPKCGKVYCWHEIYVLDRIVDLKKEEA